MAFELKGLEDFYRENLHSYLSMHHSRYTTSLRNITYDFINDNNLGKIEGYTEPIDTVDFCRKKLFDFEYPIIDRMLTSELIGSLNPKDIFEIAFVSKYFQDEIAFESFAEFKMRLRGKLLEVIPLFNLKMEVIMSLTPNDFKGGYFLEEHTTNTHNDTNVTDGNTTGKNRNIGTSFPVNYINANEELDDINYATTGNTDKNTIKRNDIFANEGGYQTDHTIDKTDRNQIKRMLELFNSLDNLIQETLINFNRLFMAIY